MGKLDHVNDKMVKMLTVEETQTSIADQSTISQFANKDEAKHGTYTTVSKATFHKLARQKGSDIASGHMASGHVHMCVLIISKYAVSTWVLSLKRLRGP